MDISRGFFTKIFLESECGKYTKKLKYIFFPK